MSTTIALPPGVTPTIVCPSWCAVPMDAHLADLPLWEGMVIHWSAPDDQGVQHSAGAFPDGTLAQDDPPLVWVRSATDGMTLEQTEAIARSMLRAVEEARA